MKPEWYLKQLLNAFLQNDYDAQTEIAKRLLYFEERGMVSNETVIKALERYFKADPSEMAVQYKSIPVKVHNGRMSEKEISATVDSFMKKHPDKVFKSFSFSIVDKDHLDVTYTFDSANAERIRRITGYLVGTLELFNNAKRAEERDRVKHSLA